MSNIAALKEFLEEVKQNLIEDQSRKGIRASGKSAQSLNVVVSGDTGKLMGDESIFYQVYGRRPGKFPPLLSIQQWIQDKGILVPERLTLKSFAFLIARKIANMGTRIFRGESPGLDYELIVEQGLDKLKKAVLSNSRIKVIELLKKKI